MGRRRKPPAKAQHLPAVPGKKALRAEQRRQVALEREACSAEAQAERERQARLELALGADRETDQEPIRDQLLRSNVQAMRRMIGLLALTAGLRAR